MRAVGAQFSRAAEQYHQRALLQRQIAGELVQMLPEALRPRRILELGCGTGFLTERLVRTFPDAEIDAIDIAPEMIRTAADHLRSTSARLRLEVADALQFEAAEPYQLLTSNCSLQWFQPIERCAERLASLLSPEGLLAASIFLEGTLAELGAVRREVAPRKRQPVQLASREQWRAQLERCGFQILSFDTEQRCQSFPDSEAMLAYLHAMGFNAAMVASARLQPLTRNELQRLCQLYQERMGTTRGDVVATFELGYVFAVLKR